MSCAGRKREDRLKRVQEKQAKMKEEEEQKRKKIAGQSSKLDQMKEKVRAEIVMAIELRFLPSTDTAAEDEGEGRA